MTAKSLLLVFVFVVLAVSTALSEMPKHTLVPDPSLEPLNSEDGKPAVRWRAYADINQDGFRDLILSEDLSYISQNGNTLSIYMGDSSGMFWLCDQMFSFPHNLCFERDGGRTKIWSSWHKGGGETSVYYSIVTDTGLVGGGSLDISPGDGGGRISQAIWSAIHNNSDISLKIEQYRIINGKVEIIEDK